MSVTSTRRVSGIYGSTIKTSYAAAQGRHSFVEDIDTTNNVLISDESDSSSYKQQEKSQSDENFEEHYEADNAADNYLSPSKNLAPLLDNDDELASEMPKKNIDIYGANQEISAQQGERLDNPYIKHLYEKNEVIEDVDEFV